MKLSLLSASALVVVVAAACSVTDGEGPPGPLAWAADPASDGAEVALEGRVEGDRVVVDVVARGVKDVHGTAFRVTWDPEALALVEVTPGDAWSPKAVLLSKEALPGTLAVGWTEKGDAAGHDATERLVLGTIRFDAKGRKGTPVAFRSERSALVDHEGRPLPVAWRAGSIPAR